MCLEELPKPDTDVAQVGHTFLFEKYKYRDHLVLWEGRPCLQSRGEEKLLLGGKPLESGKCHRKTGIADLWIKGIYRRGYGRVRWFVEH